MKNALLLAAAYATPALAGSPADMSPETLMWLVVKIVIIGLVFWCIWWFIGYCAIPEPFNKVLRVIVGLVALIVVVSLLLRITGPW